MELQHTIFWHYYIYSSRKLAPVILSNFLPHHKRIRVKRRQSTNLGFPAVWRARVRNLMTIYVGVSGVTHMQPLYHVTRHAASRGRITTPSYAHAPWGHCKHLHSMGAVWNWNVIKKWFYEMKVIKFTVDDFFEVYIIFYRVLWNLLIFSSPNCTQCELFLSFSSWPPTPRLPPSAPQLKPRKSIYRQDKKKMIRKNKKKKVTVSGAKLLRPRYRVLYVVKDILINCNFLKHTGLRRGDKLFLARRSSTFCRKACDPNTIPGHRLQVVQRCVCDRCIYRNHLL